jgi:hypothetical protein
MKSGKRKKKKDLKTREERLMEALQEIEKAALGDENPTPVTNSAKEEKARGQTQGFDNRVRRRN